MKYEFFPEEIARALPPLFAQADLGEEAIAHVKFFTPDANWTWYVTEYDPLQQIFFGLVFGLEEELGSFSLKELQEARGHLHLPVERDLYWEPKTLAEVRKLHPHARRSEEA